jgi:Holliday junction DNA helicase RuvA
MIDYVRGELNSKSPSLAVVDVGGVGYAVEIPLSTFQDLPEAGKPVKLLTHHHVREDTQKLFGFLTEMERDLFRVLIGISQVGPKVALNVLSRVPPGDLLDAVAKGDTMRLKAVPGIGPKTADRLVLELKGKLKGIGVSGRGSSRRTVSVPANPEAAARQETFDALLSLGYNEQQIVRALERTGEVVEAGAPVEEWIRKALQVM